MRDRLLAALDPGLERGRGPQHYRGLLFARRNPVDVLDNLPLIRYINTLTQEEPGVLNVFTGLANPRIWHDQKNSVQLETIVSDGVIRERPGRQVGIAGEKYVVLEGLDSQVEGNRIKRIPFFQLQTKMDDYALEELFKRHVMFDYSATGLSNSDSGSLPARWKVVFHPQPTLLKTDNLQNQAS